jgi:phosphoketolase
MDATVKHCTEGIGIWQWAGNDQDVAPDVVMACCGDAPTLETLAAVSILREHLPDLKIRVVNVVDLMKLLPQTGDKGVYLKQQLKDKLIEHKQYIDKHGQDLTEIRD